MAGAYCRFCDSRCFVLRELADGRQIHLATCAAGAAHDREVTGEDYRTAKNPVAQAEEPRRADPKRPDWATIVQFVEEERARESAAAEHTAACRNLAALIEPVTGPRFCAAVNACVRECPRDSKVRKALVASWSPA